jgi:uncharacterized protein (TIGR01777 family)
VIVAITGASGFLGRRIVAQLESRGHTVRKISTRSGFAAEAFRGADAVVNLAGEPVAQRWTDSARERIRDSRVAGTRAIVDALRAQPPRVLINASAVGYYGSRGDEVLDESASAGSDYLARIAMEWEREALRAEELGVRVVLLRTGVALGRDGGALKKMRLPFKLGVGGPIAGGRHWMPWIHADDAAAMIVWTVETASVRGPLNVTAPQPVTNAEFTRELGRALHRPAILPVPAFGLKLLFGEMSEILLASQRVVPRAALSAGYGFRFSTLSAALRNLLP